MSPIKQAQTLHQSQTTNNEVACITDSRGKEVRRRHMAGLAPLYYSHNDISLKATLWALPKSLRRPKIASRVEKNQNATVIEKINK